MDEICKALSNKIYAESAGAYAVFYEDELLDTFPDQTEKSRERLEVALNNLRELGYIDIKYAKGYTYCIAGLKKYTTTPVTTSDEIPKSQKEHKVNVSLHLFLCALWGGLVGGFIGGLFAAVIF
jgi:hypothetical protein